MEDLSHELYFRRTDWVVLVDLEVQLEPTLFIRSLRGTSDHAMPMKQVVVDWLEQDISVFRPAYLHQLSVESTP